MRPRSNPWLSHLYQRVPCLALWISLSLSGVAFAQSSDQVNAANNPLGHRQVAGWTRRVGRRMLITAANQVDYADWGSYGHRLQGLFEDKAETPG